MFSLLVFHSTRYVRLTDSKVNLEQTNIQFRLGNIFNICDESASQTNICFGIGNILNSDETNIHFRTGRYSIFAMRLDLILSVSPSSISTSVFGFLVVSEDLIFVFLLIIGGVVIKMAVLHHLSLCQVGASLYELCEPGFDLGMPEVQKKETFT